MIARREDDGTVTLVWDDDDERTAVVAREILEAIVAESNRYRRLRFALREAVETEWTW